MTITQYLTTLSEQDVDFLMLNLAVHIVIVGLKRANVLRHLEYESHRFIPFSGITSDWNMVYSFVFFLS
jgi:hypothetical protein